ncbi:glutathione S-transferase family protein [Budviciaceae bacterium BWR-B9]|uniref:Glutathione S-transferase family protein n=1 Tax=Limnobaculum allomyrinae TaxID=2791986 RepID=A0ABS1IUK3_9GAMM|nr:MULTISPECIES: glutathione binding-like protein [Limnobaculum]MBK5145354.1 glutathione S-transferase family protein [Limnobaculum allomyrinae]MBV7693218.1 glutathione S-transferase family protein [Limnobaculum sp. M2-1]
MIKFYYTPIPDGKKIAIFLEELELSYSIHPFKLSSVDYPLQTLTTLSPEERGPIIIDPKPHTGEPPLTLYGASTILVYLAEKSGHLASFGLRHRYDVLQWLFWLENKLMPTLENMEYFSHHSKRIIPSTIELYQNETIGVYRSLNQSLTTNMYIAGDRYSIADIALYPLVDDYQKQRIDLQDYPAVNNWYQRISKRQAVVIARRIDTEWQLKSKME